MVVRHPDVLSVVFADSSSIVFETPFMSEVFCSANTPAPEPEKLSELRAKTDQQILNLIHSKLEAGLNFTALAEDAYSDGNRDHAGQLLRHAEQTVVEVKQLLRVLGSAARIRLGPRQTSGSAGSPGSKS
jgi:hypothetical protein